MNLMTFDYTKANGDTSDRCIVTHANENTHVMGIDVAELEPASLGDFLIDYKELMEEHNKKVTELMSSYDIKHNFRLFKRVGMSNIEIQKI